MKNASVSIIGRGVFKVRLGDKYVILEAGINGSTYLFNIKDIAPVDGRGNKLPIDATETFVFIEIIKEYFKSSFWRRLYGEKCEFVDGD